MGYRKKFWRRVLDVLEVGLKELLELDPECVSVLTPFYWMFIGRGEDVSAADGVGSRGG